MRVSTDISVSDLVDELQHAKHEMALVTEDGRTVGLVTLTDAIELIVGESEDPLDVLVA